jgi:hypothetical protein
MQKSIMADKGFYLRYMYQSCGYLFCHYNIKVNAQSKVNLFLKINFML